MSKYHYIGWYISPLQDKEYTGNVPGKLKMRYVAKKVVESGNQLTVLSLADKNERFFYKKKITVQDSIQVIYTGGFGSDGKIGRFINTFMKIIQFCLYIIMNCKKEDIIIIYHSVTYTKLLAKLKKFFKRTVICEVEEIYGYSAVEDKVWVAKEIEAIKMMDKFIFVNAGIPKSLYIMPEKYVISYGVCDVPKRKVERYNDGKIHVVYAGTVENKKLGAFTAVETARYLSEQFVVHIIGFGKQDTLNLLQDRIKEINNTDANHALVQYDGYKSGDELDQFLFKCHIGLSSNVMRPNFANNTFPSKVITYMCHDLSVVLGYAEAFYSVPEAKKWTFYMSHEPKEIAKAIASAPIACEGYYEEDIRKMDLDLIDFLK